MFFFTLDKDGLPYYINYKRVRYAKIYILGNVRVVFYFEENRTAEVSVKSLVEGQAILQRFERESPQ